MSGRKLLSWCLIITLCITPLKVKAKGDAYQDVSKSDWYYEYVSEVSEKGIMTGLSEHIFGPNQLLARAQFATILYRMEGAPEVKYTDKFPDVARGQFYTAPVLWASKDDTKIITGYNNGMFGPADSINREQMATMMYRYAKYKGYDLSAKGNLSQYPDGKKVNDFAKQAMEWAVGSGLISGDQGKLNPQGESNRAVCATVIQRFLKLGEHTHSYVETKRVEAACTTDGYYIMTCAGCKDARTTLLPKIGHDYKVTEIIAATCEGKGTQLESCARCKHTKTTVLEDAKGHLPGAWVITKQPTDMQEGQKIQKCSTCSKILETVSIPKLEHIHQYVEVERVEPTCVLSGKKVDRCSCSATSVTALLALGHSYSSWEIEKQPTETETGVRAKKCSRCSNCVTETIPALPPSHTHSYMETVQKEPDCIEDGIMEYKCSCDDYYTETIVSSGHKYQVSQITEATCDKAGSRKECCSACGDIRTTETEKAKGHVPGQWEITIPATVQKEGEKVQKCTVCTVIIKKEIIPKLNHSHQYEVTENIAATCTEDGYYVMTCSICGESYRTINIKTGHIICPWEIINQPTLDQDGERIRQCITCGFISEREIIPRLQITDIRINGKSSLNAGSSAKLTAAFVPATIISTSLNTKWSSSDTDIAAIDSNGVVTTKKAGAVTITAEAGNLKTTFKMEVLPAITITGIKIVGQNKIDAGGKTQLAAILTPSTIISVPTNTKWSSADTDIATVDPYGMVTAHKEGTVCITASAGAVSYDFMIVVLKKEIEAVAVEIGGPEVVYVGRTGVYSAVVLPAGAVQAVTWSSNSGGLSIDETGTVKGNYPVDTTIMAKTANNKMALKEVKVCPITTSLKLTADNRVAVGGTNKVNVKVMPKGAAENITFTSSNPVVATIDESGVIHGLKNGTVIITALAKDPSRLQDTMELIVGTGSSDPGSQNYIKAMTIKGKDGSDISEMTIGDKKTISCNPVFNGASKEIPITWESSDESVVSINGNAYEAAIEVKSAGTAILTATATDAYKCQTIQTVTIAEPLVQTLTLSTPKTELNIGEIIQLDKIVTPENAANNKFSWSSTNTAVATVDENGKVTAIGKEKGIVYITCRSKNGVTAQIKLNVMPKLQVTKFQITNGTMLKGSGAQIDYAFSLSSFNKYRFKSSNTNVATVTNDGYISAVGIGHAVISLESTDGTILSGNRTLEIDVNEQELLTVTVDKNNIMLGDVGKAVCNGAISPGIWSSSNPEVATVDSLGNIVTIARGTANIRYQTLFSSAETEVCVIPVQKISSLKISTVDKEVIVGGIIQLTKTVNPAEMSDYTRWTSLNPEIADIDGNGVVTGKAAGTATISLSAIEGSNQSQQIAIRVYEGDRFAGKAANDNNVKYMYTGDSIRMLTSKEKTVQGSDLFVYHSSDTNLATVDARGNITARRTGLVTITQTASTGAIYRENLTIINPSGDYFRPYVKEIAINKGANCDFLVLGTNNALAWTIADAEKIGLSSASSEGYNLAFVGRIEGAETITLVNTEGYAASFNVNILDSTDMEDLTGMQFDPEMSTQIMNGINQYRNESGKTQLRFYQFAQDIAKAQAISQHRMAQYAPTGYSYDYSMHNSIQISAYYWGYKPTAEEVIQAWKKSPGHNASMLRETDEVIGAAAYKTPYGYGIYVTKQQKAAVDSPYNW